MSIQQSINQGLTLIGAAAAATNTAEAKGLRKSIDAADNEIERLDKEIEQSNNAFANDTLAKKQQMLQEKQAVDAERLAKIKPTQRNIRELANRQFEHLGNSIKPFDMERGFNAIAKAIEQQNTKKNLSSNSNLAME